MCRGVVWLELDRALVFADRTSEIDFIKKEHFAKRGVRFGQIRIQAESFERPLFRLRESITLGRGRVIRK